MLRLIDGKTVLCAAFAPDGAVLAAGVHGGLRAGIIRDVALRFWRVAAGWAEVVVPTRVLVNCLAFHPAGHTLAHTGVPLARGPTDRVNDVHLYPLTGVSRFDTDRLEWDDTDSPASQWCRLSCLAFTPGGERLLVGAQPWLFSSRGEWGYWEFAAGGTPDLLSARRTARPEPVHLAAAAADGRVVLAGRDGVGVSAVTPGGEWVLEPKRPQFRRACRALAASPVGDLIAGVDGHRVLLWRLGGPDVAGECRGHLWDVNAVAFSPDGTLLATGGGDGRTILWDLVGGPRTVRYDWKVGSVRALAFAPDGFTLAVAGDTGLVIVDVE